MAAWALAAAGRARRALRHWTARRWHRSTTPRPSAPRGVWPPCSSTATRRCGCAPCWRSASCRRSWWRASCTRCSAASTTRRRACAAASPCAPRRRLAPRPAPRATPRTPHLGLGLGLGLLPPTTPLAPHLAPRTPHPYPAPRIPHPATLPPYQVRIATLGVLGALPAARQPARMAQVLAQLEHPEPGVRAAAVDALGALQASLPSLVVPESAVVVTAVLGERGQARGVTPHPARRQVSRHAYCHAYAPRTPHPASRIHHAHARRAASSATSTSG